MSDQEVLKIRSKTKAFDNYTHGSSIKMFKVIIIPFSGQPVSAVHFLCRGRQLNSSETPLRFGTQTGSVPSSGDKGEKTSLSFQKPSELRWDKPPFLVPPGDCLSTNLELITKGTGELASPYCRCPGAQDEGG